MKADGDVHVRIPGSVAEAMDLPAEQLQEEMHRELALALYAQDRLSGGQARELAGMDRRAFMRQTSESLMRCGRTCCVVRASTAIASTVCPRKHCSNPTSLP